MKVASNTRPLLVIEKKIREKQIREAKRQLIVCGWSNAAQTSGPLISGIASQENQESRRGDTRGDTRGGRVIPEVIPEMKGRYQR